MNYTPIVLFLLGVLGIILHNLVELNKLNKATDGNVNFRKYFKLEIFSIIISFIFVVACVITSQEINQLQNVGKWLGLAFIAVGYMGQSILIFFMGKASKYIEKEKENNG